MGAVTRSTGASRRTAPTARLTRMTDAPVLLDVTDGVATVTLHRPEAMNSLDVATKVLLLETLRQVADLDSVRCVVLTGSGRAFCTGQDLKEHIGLLRSSTGPRLSTVEEHYNPIVTALVEMPKPTVAAVNGVAAGAGASLALACDLRLVADTAGFNFAFANVALSCDTGMSWTLQRIVGRARALELLYFPRTVGAEESASLGLATTVVAPDDLVAETAALAARLAAGPTVALASIREAVTFAGDHPFSEALATEARLMNRTGATADHEAAVAAFVAKQKPVFEGR